MTRRDTLAEADVSYFVWFIQSRIGVQLSGKEYLIASRLRHVATEAGLDSAAAVISSIRRGDQMMAAAAVDAMAIHETSFLRDRHPFDALTSHVLPRFVASSSRPITIWSGACSTGQEPYSIALAIRRAMPEAAHRFRIIGTDVSGEVLKTARAGTYSDMVIGRGLPTELVEENFERRDGAWTVRPELRSMVEFRALNLTGELTGIPRCEVVLLRNVLFYFSDQLRIDVLRRVRDSALTADGCLVLGASESPAGVEPPFHSARVGSSILYFVKPTSDSADVSPKDPEPMAAREGAP